MKTIIGLRREDINKWEKRVPIIPSHARELLEKNSIEVRVQPSNIRVFDDEAYRMAGMQITEDLSPCPIIFALKEIPIELIQKDKVYVFFSHTAKGQSQNMPMLKRMMEMGCTIIDYEKMVDAQGRRVLYFGNYAGHAGMIDTLWALGKRLETEGRANPFTSVTVQKLQTVGDDIGVDDMTIGTPDQVAPAPAQLQIVEDLQLQIQGTVGATYRIDFSNVLPATNWVTIITNFGLCSRICGPKWPSSTAGPHLPNGTE